MELTVRDTARLFKVSEKTVYHWVKDRALPAYQVNDQYRFNRAELLEWATTHRINVPEEFFHQADAAAPPLITLTDALRAGGIHRQPGGTDKVDVLRDVVNHMPLPEDFDRQFLLQVLLARESLGSTALGNGIAVPHARNPIVMHVPRPMITLCFLEQAIDFGAVDGKLVHTLFTIVSPTIKVHLHLLSRLALALQAARFTDALTKRLAETEILAACDAVERGLAHLAGPASRA